MAAPRLQLQNADIGFVGDHALSAIVDDIPDAGGYGDCLRQENGVGVILFAEKVFIIYFIPHRVEGAVVGLVVSGYSVVKSAGCQSAVNTVDIVGHIVGFGFAGGQGSGKLADSEAGLAAKAVVDDDRQLGFAGGYDVRGGCGRNIAAGGICGSISEAFGKDDQVGVGHVAFRHSGGNDGAHRDCGGGLSAFPVKNISQKPVVICKSSGVEQGFGLDGIGICARRGIVVIAVRRAKAHIGVARRHGVKMALAAADTDKAFRLGLKLGSGAAVGLADGEGHDAVFRQQVQARKVGGAHAAVESQINQGCGIAPVGFGSRDEG